MSILKISGLSKYYLTQSTVVRALTDINLEFSVGEFVAITGESGSGKSTLAHILAGILGYEDGEMYVKGTPTSHYDKDEWERYRRDEISFISQSYGIISGNTVLENVEAALLISGVGKADSRAMALEILKKVDLESLQSKPAEKLSSGQKQRLSIARALAKPAKILIADEPTGNLDSENSHIILRLLKEAAKERLVILITHDFEEACEYVSRRLVLSDGYIVTDAKIKEALANIEEKADKQVRKNRAESKNLKYYISRLVLKSKPILSIFLCLVLSVSTVMSFVFLGSFIVALDDTSTREYDANAFRNGSHERIVVMNADGSALTDEDYQRLLSLRHVESIERFGYFSDVNYYYREDIDFLMKKIPIYSSLIGAFEMEQRPEFLDTELFASTIPYTDKSIITEGRAPETIYEIASAAPSHSIGDKVTVYFKDINNWGFAYNMQLIFTVVGKAEGEGLYFSDELAATLVTDPFIIVPYEEGSFKIDLAFKPISEDVFYFTSGNVYSTFQPGAAIPLETPDGERVPLEYGGLFNTSLPKLLLVNKDNFYKITDFSNQNQVSVFIKDYAYTERVLDKLGDMGYVAISPFKEGSVDVDPQLATERIVTLVISLAVFIITAILSLVLIKVMFASYSGTYKLFSDIGLTSEVAYSTVRINMIMFTFIGELLGIALIALMCLCGVEKFLNVYKYLTALDIFVLYMVHLLTSLLTIPIVKRALQRSVFVKKQKKYDLNFAELEEVL